MEEFPEKYLADPAAIEAINSLDTARLSLRWALERIHSLENLKEELSSEKDREAALREKAQKDYESLDRLLSLRPTGPAERALFEQKLEDLVTLKLAGKLDLAPLAARELSVRREEEKVLARQAELDSETENRRRELDGERRRLMAELEQEARTAEERRRGQWLERQSALEKDGAGRSADIESKERELQDARRALQDSQRELQEKERELAVRAARLEEQSAARLALLEEKEKNAAREIQERLSLLMREAEGLWAEREKTIRGAWEAEKNASLAHEAQIQGRLSKALDDLSQEAARARGLKDSEALLEAQCRSLRDAHQAQELALQEAALRKERALEETAAQKDRALRESAERAQDSAARAEGLSKRLAAMELEISSKEAAETQLGQALSAVKTREELALEAVARLEALLAAERGAREAEGGLSRRERELHAERLVTLQKDLSCAKQDLIEEQARAKALSEAARSLEMAGVALEARVQGLRESLSLREAEIERERASGLRDKSLLEERIAQHEAAGAELQRGLYRLEETLARESRARQDAAAGVSALREEAESLGAQKTALEDALRLAGADLQGSLGKIASLENAKAEAEASSRSALQYVERLRQQTEDLKAREQQLDERDRQLKWSAAHVDASNWDSGMRARYERVEELEKRSTSALELLKEKEAEAAASREALADAMRKAELDARRMEEMEKQTAEAQAFLKDKETAFERRREELEQETASLREARAEADRQAERYWRRLGDLEKRAERGEALGVEKEKEILRLKEELEKESAALREARSGGEYQDQVMALRISELEKRLAESDSLVKLEAQNLRAQKEESKVLSEAYAKFKAQLADERAAAERALRLAQDKAQEQDIRIADLEKALADERAALQRTRGVAELRVSEQTSRLGELEKSLTEEGAAANRARIIAEDKERQEAQRARELEKSLAEERAAAERGRIIAENRAHEQASRVRDLEQALADSKAVAGQFAQDFHSAKAEVERLKSEAQKVQEAPPAPLPQKAPAGEDLQNILGEAFKSPAGEPTQDIEEAEKALQEKLKVAKLETEELYAEITSLKTRLSEAETAMAARQEAERAQEIATESEIDHLKKKLSGAVAAARRAVDALGQEAQRRKKLEEYILSRQDPGKS